MVSRLSLLVAVGVGALSSGCSGDDGTTPPEGGLDAEGRIVEACYGLKLKGMKYSPGGTTLPNKCAPFHPTTNNPYAVRCIDALPDFKTPFDGDEYCILPPPPELGIQVGPHPQGKDYWEQMWRGDYSGYQNPPAEWVMQPGEEKTQNYQGSADNQEPNTYYRTYFRMRTGSHHQIVFMYNNDGTPDQWLRGGQLFDPEYGQVMGILGGEQRPDDGNPSTLEKPSEDAGQFLDWPANPKIIYNMHHFNSTQQPILREAWINVWWEKDATQRVNWYMGLNSAQYREGPMAQPGEVRDWHFKWTWGGADPLRLLRVFGHRHFWTTNFSAWIVRKDNPEPELIYQSFNWEDMPTFRYDSVVQNPTPNAETYTDGARSGTLELNPGDELHFNCHIEYNEIRAAQDPDAPAPVEPLRFGNQVYNREMCIQFGNITSAAPGKNGVLGFPELDPSPVPEFASR